MSRILWFGLAALFLVLSVASYPWRPTLQQFPQATAVSGTENKHQHTTPPVAQTSSAPPEPIEAAAVATLPSPPEATPAPPAALAQQNIPEENVEWAGSRSLYNPSVWSAGRTVVQRVTLNGNPIDVWAVYLSSQDDEIVSLPANPGANLKVCQARVGSVGTMPIVTIKSPLYDDHALAWNLRTYREDRQCNSEATFWNTQNSGVMVDLRVHHAQGGGNYFLVIADKKIREDTGYNQSLKQAAGFAE
jgi:hypothetical protein